MTNVSEEQRLKEIENGFIGHPDDDYYFVDSRDFRWLIAEHHRLSDELARAREDIQRGYDWQRGYADQLVKAQTRLDAALRVVSAARALMESTMFCNASTWVSHSAERELVRSALAEFDRASAEVQENPKQSQEDLSIWSNSPSLSSSRSNDRLINGA